MPRRPAASSCHSEIVNILAIRFARLGDVILLLPALVSLKRAFPDSRLTFLTGHRCASVAEMCPAIDEVLAVDRIAMRDGPVFGALQKMFGVVRDVRHRDFDLVVDFHSFRETNLLTWLSGADVRVGMKRFNAPYLRFCFNRPPVLEDKSLHVSEMFGRVVESIGGRMAATPSSLVIPDELKRWAAQVSPSDRRLVLFLDAPVPERIWPPERFAAVADSAIEKFGAAAIVISSRQGEHLVTRVEQTSRNRKQIVSFTDVSVPQLTALIGSARVFVSNDTGPMHIGPAVGVRTLGLFSVGFPEHFRPAGANDKFLRANPIEKIETRDVIAAVEELWTTAGPGLRC
jgi:ADP-heptose:LPS heptosyltransferase